MLFLNSNKILTLFKINLLFCYLSFPLNYSLAVSDPKKEVKKENKNLEKASPEEIIEHLTQKVNSLVKQNKKNTKEIIVMAKKIVTLEALERKAQHDQTFYDKMSLSLRNQIVEKEKYAAKLLKSLQQRSEEIGKIQKENYDQKVEMRNLTKQVQFIIGKIQSLTKVAAQLGIELPKENEIIKPEKKNVETKKVKK